MDRKKFIEGKVIKNVRFAFFSYLLFCEHKWMRRSQYSLQTVIRRVSSYDGSLAMIYVLIEASFH